MKKIKKRALSMPQEYLGWLILGVILLIVVITIILVSKDKMIKNIEGFKYFLRFRGGE